jgi:hypothetical protein
MAHRLACLLVGQFPSDKSAAVHLEQLVMDIPMYAAFRLQFK